MRVFGQLGMQAWWRDRLELGDVTAVMPFSGKITVKVEIRNQADRSAAIQHAVVDFEGDDKREGRAWILPQSKDQSKDMVPIGRDELIVDWKPSSGDGAVSGIRVWIEGVEMAVPSEGIEQICAKIAARK